MNSYVKFIIYVGIIAVVLLGTNWAYQEVSSALNLSPSETIESFYEHAGNGEVDEAKKLVSEEVIKSYESSWMASSISGIIAEEGETYSKVNVLEDTETITAQIATVDVELTEDGETFVEEYRLVKEDDQWKITFMGM